MSPHDSTPTPSRPSDDPAIAVRNLTKRYGSGDESVVAVDDVTFEVESGTAVGLLGPNGAGKTTMIKSLLGLIVPTAGEAEIAGVDVQADPTAAYRRVGAMLEGARNVYWRLTVRENLAFFAALGGRSPADARERHDDLLDQFDVLDVADTPVRELSRGMQQKVKLAATLARDVPVVFLDEPTLGLDVESTLELRRELRRLVEEEDTTLLLSSHDMDVIEDVCDRVIIVNDGEVVADDTVENLLSLFRTRAYEVTVAERVDSATRDDLERRFDAAEFEDIGGRERFVAHVTGDEFYALVDLLREGGHTVDAVDAVDPDLAEVFLHVTDRSDREPRAGTEAGPGPGSGPGRETEARSAGRGDDA